MNPNDLYTEAHEIYYDVRYALNEMISDAVLAVYLKEKLSRADIEAMRKIRQTMIEAVAQVTGKSSETIREILEEMHAIHIRPADDDRAELRQKLTPKR